MTKQRPEGTSGGARAARERLRAEREQEALRRRRRRAGRIGGVVAAVLVAAAGIGIAVGRAGEDSADDAAGRPVVAPRGVPAGGVTISDGPADARGVLTVYEDFRCPYCHQVEVALGPVIHQLADSGRIRVEYHIASFLDGRLGGNGSRRAANAAACAQDAGLFRPYHDLLFAEQPEESDDAFADRDHLLDLASRVDGLRGPAFDGCVTDATYAPWVDHVEDRFAAGDVRGTPTLTLNGQPVTVLRRDGGAITPDAFRAQIDRILGPAAP
jgi:protein-disulfide isomerase